MSKPLTFNDLKRLKSQSSLKRFKIINASVVRTQSLTPLTLNPFISRNTISVNNVDNLAAQGKAFAVTKAYTGGTINNTYLISNQNILYYPGTLNVDRTSPGPNLNLWSVNGQPIQLSDNFSYDIPSTNISVKQDFWNEITGLSATNNFTVSTIIFNEIKYDGLSGYKIGNIDWPTTDTITISTDDYNVYRRGDVKLFFDRTNSHTNNLFDFGTVNYQSISVFKDNVFLETLSAKDAVKGIQFYLSESYEPSVHIRPDEDIRQDEFDANVGGSRYFLSAFNVDKTTTTITGSNSSINGLATSKKNQITNFSYVSYSAPLTAGEYEFKFEVMDKNNENNKFISSKRLNVETVVNNVWRESLETVVDIITSNPPYTDYTHLAVLTSADYQRGGWSSDFWGFSARDILNFSGMCWNSQAAEAVGQPWPKRNYNRVTLITPRHGIAAEHFNGFTNDGRNQGWFKGDHMFFYDHTTGESVSAIIENEYRLASFKNANGAKLSAFITEELINDVVPGIYDLPQYGNTYNEVLSDARVFDILRDCQLIYLDRDVTAGKDIKVYPFATIPEQNSDIIDWPTSKYPLITTGVGNRGNDRRNAVISTNVKSDNLYYNPYSYNNALNTSFKAVSALSEHIPLNYTGGSFIVGDSGDPTFMLINKELAIYTINFTADITGGATGGNYIDKRCIDRLQFFVNDIGNTEGYKLSTVQVV